MALEENVSPARAPAACPGPARSRGGAGAPGRPLRTLQALLGAAVEDLQQVEGIGENRARFIREGLSRLAESSLLERYA